MERILVIDDEASIRKALQIGLTSKHFEVDLASDGLNGIQLGHHRAYDILIADLSLPDIDGLEVIKRLKHSTPEIIPIIITGKGSIQTSLEAIRLEVSDYLEKPLSLASVKEAISRGLEKRDQRRKTIEHKVHQKLLSDSLTGLPDRSLFMDRLNRAIAAIDRYEDRSFALLLIDIDQFKGVNDAYGHRVGDRVLSELSNRFKACIRLTDTVARMDGDEFAVLVEEFDSTEKVVEVAERCQKMAQKVFSIDGIKINLRTSIGIVVKTTFYESPDDVLRDAEMALTYCKEQGGGIIKVFEKMFLEQAIESLQLENGLRLGIQNQEFTMQYQPIIRINDMRMVGLEALIRWHQPEHGIIYPDEFIPKAEEIGLINQIGNWVLSESCRQIKEWQLIEPGFDKMCLNINISGQQFLHPGFINSVKDVIHEHSLDPGNLKLELTESVLMKASKSSTETLMAMQNIGIKLVIDDFGTGYSSFSYLQQFPLVELKIGKSFIQKMVDDRESFEIVRSIVGLANRLGLHTVAEGVETKEQFNKVKHLGFDMVQGFFIAKPVNAKSVIKYVKKFH
ncbi:putative bifunctional diguanylate cyclase/phosphodiesterase [Desulfosarcina sp.]|uniref:putative bifunctional diguanylate cyclase/phosphodiesterase n=1 Tax=Desulfosarcina sp. TaxID=2027861 RepID=UPI00356161D7